MKDSAQSMHSARSSDKSVRRASANSTSVRSVLETMSSAGQQKISGQVCLNAEVQFFLLPGPCPLPNHRVPCLHGARPVKYLGTGT